jgi:hypothetical protein
MPETTKENNENKNNMADYSGYAQAGSDTLGAVLGYLGQRQESNFGCGARPASWADTKKKQEWQKCYDAALATQNPNQPAPVKDNTVRNIVIGGVAIIAIAGISFMIYKLAKK